ncbi:hypothetical protein SSX86_002012 [Deinandra increscens subsp. villosa]|uniref:RRM domain-containing protein n=1 Tax=Deinandra increscens subsp. villosa TaxID=3103831 RepID=A0AAP0HCQ1_9ASTR
MPSIPTSPTTSYLLINLSPECTASMIWRKCCHLGNLRDAFIPNKRDRRGNIYGFVRFDAVKNHDTMIEKLRKINLGSTVHSVVIARTNKPPPSLTSNPLNHRPLTRPTTHYSNPPANQRMPPRHATNAHSHPPHHYRVVRKGITYKNIAEGTLHRPAPGISLPIHVKIPATPPLVPTTWKTPILIGDAISMDHLYNANLVLSTEGIKNVDTHYVGGLSLLLKFDSSCEAKKFLTDQRLVWKKIFKNLCIWEGQALKNERVAQIICRGVPFHLRCKDTFNAIGKALGELVDSSDFDWESYDVTTGTCYILTNRVERIEEKVCLDWNNTRYDIWVCESTNQWCPPVYPPCYSSSSESSESLDDDSVESLYNDIEDGEFRPTIFATPPETYSGRNMATPTSPAKSSTADTISGMNASTPDPNVRLPPTLEFQQETSSSLCPSQKSSPGIPSPPPSPLAPPPPLPHANFPDSPSRVPESAGSTAGSTKSASLDSPRALIGPTHVTRFGPNKQNGLKANFDPGPKIPRSRLPHFSAIPLSPFKIPPFHTSVSRPPPSLPPKINKPLIPSLNLPPAADIPDLNCTARSSMGDGSSNQPPPHQNPNENTSKRRHSTLPVRLSNSLRPASFLFRPQGACDTRRKGPNSQSRIRSFHPHPQAPSMPSQSIQSSQDSSSETRKTINVGNDIGFGMHGFTSQIEGLIPAGIGTRQ